MTQSEDISTTEHAGSNRTLRGRWIAVGVAVLTVAALVLTPPYVNMNRYRRRITTTMSQSLGRPVHLDNVTLHLLPVPGLTLSNLVVSEDPSFGYEPVIRANTVEATIRASSLWRRQVEFSRIHFIDPSVNLVRNAQGRWNLEDVLMQASHVQTAPTAQRKAGPAPRFPYIEATGARVNVKLGNEKMPFSLSEAQFALWLPSPQLWRVRLRGRPTRTDSNVSQTGEINLEGSLQRAQKMANVPLDMHGTWNDAPLGETSRLLGGNDAGWRGTAFVEIRVAGELSNAAVTTHLQFNDLRRADFVPAQPLDITVDCSATADVARATLTNAGCALPIGDTKPIMLSAPSVDLENPRRSQAKMTFRGVPLVWTIEWAKLFAPSIPPSLEPPGDVSGEVDWNTVAASWQGSLSAKLPKPNPDASGATNLAPADATQFVLAVNSSPVPAGAAPAPIARLSPVELHPGPGSALTLAGQADANGYGLQLTGTGTDAQVLALANSLPPLNEGVAAALTSDAKAATPRVALTCSRLWGGAQTCTPLPQAAVPKPLRARHRR